MGQRSRAVVWSVFGLCCSVELSGGSTDGLVCSGPATAVGRRAHPRACLRLFAVAMPSPRPGSQASTGLLGSCSSWPRATGSLLSLPPEPEWPLRMPQPWACWVRAGSRWPSFFRFSRLTLRTQPSHHVPGGAASSWALWLLSGAGPLRLLKGAGRLLGGDRQLSLGSRPTSGFLGWFFMGCGEAAPLCSVGQECGGG